jgi:hypothetical protein
MVSSTRGTPDPRRIRRLKQPQAIEVEADEHGTPLRLRLSVGWREVHLLRRPWRIDQYWWRPEPVRRMYFRIAPGEGAPLTVYQDLLSGEWRRQEYQ